jgi:hypothetical protein
MTNQHTTTRWYLAAASLLAVTLFGMTACDGGSSGDECSSASDCSEGQVCESGSCVTSDDPDTMGGMDSSMDPDTNGGPDDVGPDTSDTSDTNGGPPTLPVNTITLDDGSTAKTFGVQADGRADNVTDIEVTADAVYVALHAKGNPLTANTIFEDLGFLVKFNRSDGSLAWTRRVEAEDCDTKVYGIEVAGNGNIFTLSDYRKACTEGVSASISAPLYAKFQPNGDLVQRDRRTNPNYCYRSMDLAPDDSSMIGGGQTNCRQDNLSQYPLFGRINSNLSSQVPRELSGSGIGGGWIRDVETLSNGTTIAAGDVPPANNTDTPEPFISALNTNNSTQLTTTYSPGGIDVTGVAATADNIYISGTQVSGTGQAVVLVASRSDGSFQSPTSLGNSPSEGKDVRRGPNDNIWVLSNPDDGQAARIDELTPGNLNSPTTTTIGFGGANVASVTPNTLAVTSEDDVAIGGSLQISGESSAQAFVRLPGTGQ